MADIIAWPHTVPARVPRDFGAAGRPAKIVAFDTPTRTMADSSPPPFIDLRAPCPSEGDVRPGAAVIEGVAHNGKPCRIVDNTGEVPRQELLDVLDALIREKKFGVGGLSASGGNTISLNQPLPTHIQFGDKLYRLLLFPYEARIEPF